MVNAKNNLMGVIYNNFEMVHQLVKTLSYCMCLTYISQASFFGGDTGKQYSLRCDAAERGVLSGAILFA